MLKRLILATALCVFASPLAAQWQVPNHAVPIGRGAGVTGFNSVAPGTAGLALVSNGASADPTFQVIGTGGLPPGVFTNTRSAYTGTGSMATTDCGKTVALGGSAFYTFTVNAASTYNAACAVIITNEDNTCPSGGASTCRGKTLAINGYTSFILWPGQTFVLLNQNNVWRYNLPGRWVHRSNMQWNVNHASGSDTSDGLGTGAGAFATMQHCVDVMEASMDFNGFGPTCKNVAETFTENNVIHTHPIVGYHVISITGDTTTPSNVVWQVSGTGNTAIQTRDTGMAIVTGFKFVSTGTANNFIQSGQLGICDFGSIEFGANSGGSNIHLTQGGVANWFGGSLSITADMFSFASMDGEGHLLMDGATVSIPNARTWGAFLIMTGPGYASMTSMTFTGTGAGAGSTGAQYSILKYSTLAITGTTLPGATPGVINGVTGTGNFMLDNAPTLAGAMNANSLKITSLASATATTDAANFGQVGAVLLATLTASNSATLSNTTVITSAYNSYLIVVQSMVPVTNAVKLTMQVSEDSGGSWKTATYLDASTNTDAIYVSSSNIDNTAGAGFSANYIISGVNETDRKKMAVGKGTVLTGGVVATTNIAGWYNGGNAAINGFRWQQTSGNISTGKIFIYGLR